MLVVFDVAAQVAARRDGLAIDGDDDVAASHDRLVADLHAASASLNAGLLRTRGHLLDQQALLCVRDAQLLLGLRTQIGQWDAGDADLWMTVLAGLDQLCRHALDHVDRNREPHALVAARLRQDRRVDADHLAGGVEQRTARIARIDRDIRLNERHEILLRQIASLRADDAGGHRIFEAKRLADCDDPFANLQLVRVADCDSREILGIDLQQCKINVCVRSDDVPFYGAASATAE